MVLKGIFLKSNTENVLYGSYLVGCVDLGTLPQQDFYHGVVTVSGGNVQARFSIEIGTV